MHIICSNTNTILDQLRKLIITNNNIDQTLLQTDELGMTALHLLCLNPNATPEIFKILANACPQAATMQAEMVTHVEYEFGRVVDVTREMVTPIKLLMKAKGIAYYDNDFDEEGHMILDTALQKGWEWNDLNLIISIQSLNLGVANETNNLYPFMQAATVDMNLETLYHLAMFDPKLIYENTFEFYN